MIYSKTHPTWVSFFVRKEVLINEVEAANFKLSRLKGELLVRQEQ